MGARNKLSVTKIKTLQKKGAYADGNGLYLQIRSKGDNTFKSWIFRYMRNGKAHNMGLGSIHVVSLAEARIAASEAQKQLYHGIDPLVEKKRIKTRSQALTFSAGAEIYINGQRSKWKNPKHASQWSNTLRDYADPVIGSLGLDQITHEHIVQILEPIWTSKAETASRVRGRIEKILDWAEVKGHRSGKNPARWKGNLEHSLPERVAIQKVKHHSALPYAQVPDFYKKLLGREGVAALALRFLILTATRTSEVRFATADEIDFETQTWTIPAERMKAGKEQRVPLTTHAKKIAEAQVSENTYLFSPFTEQAMSENAMLALLKRMEVQGITVHGFRSSFRDWAAEKTDVPREIIESALAHNNPDRVEAAYLRTDMLTKRRVLMDQWETFVVGLPD